ncbi:flavin reductase family protein [Thalassotalea marina]|uniref:Flavin reductase like domain-containing protein n=1 Tax=Thalassotalea marina TaxID=1673741 RepID=A0A919BJ06_9GAMM|nr:flavin reductase family protein [Thalassotalea marina]GHF93716.1 hypothetical protein GCM10017161_22790 [Thalassotalea marina]
MNLDFSKFNPLQRYHLMTQTIIPRPIAWALTSNNINQNEVENLNLAPFSYFTAVSSSPALLMISVGKKPNGDLKDTLVNIRENKKMVIHIANEQQADIVTETAASLAHGESELIGVNTDDIEMVPFDGFELPRIKQCDIAYGCELFEIKELGDVPQSLIFVEIKSLYVNPDVITENNNRIKIHADRISPLARLGASEYSGITSPFTKVRPE